MAIKDFPHCRVLLVEDNYYLATDAQRALVEAGAVVIGPCARADDALRLAESEPPDCAIVDINLGQGPSFDIASWLFDHDVPFVFLTGYDAGVIPERFSNVEHIEKPVDMPRLLRTVEHLCAGRS